MYASNTHMVDAKVLVDDMLLKSKHQNANASVVIAGASCTLDALSYCMQLLTGMQVTICINAAKLQLCVLENSRSRHVHRRLRSTMSTCTGWHIIINDHVQAVCPGQGC